MKAEPGQAAFSSSRAEGASVAPGEPHAEGASTTAREAAQPTSQTSSPEGACASAGASNRGGVIAFAAFIVWGLLPLYWRELETVNPVEVLCHRMCWSFVTLIPILYFSGRTGEAVRAFTNKKSLLTLFCSSVTLAFNWGIYIWAVNAGHVLDASLGYFITPLLNMMFGVIVFKERPSPLAWLAIFLAAAGVAYQVYSLGHFPWVAVAIGGSFALYSLIRKVVLVEALPGLFVETSLLFPVAAGVIIYFALQGQTAIAKGDIYIDLLLAGSGLITTVPLIAFAYGARRIAMTTLGLLQYVMPSMAFIMGITLFKEDLNMKGLVTFAMIWGALALYTWDNLRRNMKKRRSA